jgi:hypothetical protein
MKRLHSIVRKIDVSIVDSFVLLFLIFILLAVLGDFTEKNHLEEQKNFPVDDYKAISMSFDQKKWNSFLCVIGISEVFIGGGHWDSSVSWLVCRKMCFFMGIGIYGRVTRL